MSARACSALLPVAPQPPPPSAGAASVQGRALRARPADAARRPTDAEPQRRGRGRSWPPRPEGPRRRRNFFEPRMHKNCTENTIFGHCAPRHRHAPNPILGRILGANLRRSGSAGGGRKIGMCLWQTPKDRPQMVSKCGTLTCNFKCQRWLPVMCFARRRTINSHAIRRRHHVYTSHETPVPKNRAPMGRGRAAPQAKLKTANKKQKKNRVLASL